jgi:hypothetical protein
MIQTTDYELFYSIQKVPRYAQTHNLSCEPAGAAMMLCSVLFRGQTLTDAARRARLKELEERVIDLVYDRGSPRLHNPHKRFRGNIDGRFNSLDDYGVYAGPVAAAVNQVLSERQAPGHTAAAEYRDPALPLKAEYDRVEAEVANGHPVLVWMTSHPRNQPVERVDEQGDRYVLLAGEHVWVVVGVYRSLKTRRFLINNPWGGARQWVLEFPRWDVFDCMRVVVRRVGSTSASTST